MSDESSRRIYKFRQEFYVDLQHLIKVVDKYEVDLVAGP